jgi:hypothetical protein
MNQPKRKLEKPIPIRAAVTSLFARVAPGQITELPYASMRQRIE